MAELKEVLEMIGLDATLADKPITDIKAAFEPSWLPIANAHLNPVVSAKITAGTYAKLKKKFGEAYGIDKKDYAGDDVEIEDLFKKAKEILDAKIKALEENGDGKNVDAKVKDLNDQLVKLKAIADGHELNYKKVGDDFETYKKTVETEKRTGKVKTAFDAAFSKLPWSDTANDLTKTGFKAVISEKYDFVVDDKDAVSVVNKQGQPVPHPKVAGQFAGIDDIMLSEMPADLVKKNNLKGGAPAKVAGNGGGGDNKNEGGNTRIVAPRAYPGVRD